jgi:hypothetical protein
MATKKRTIPLFSPYVCEGGRVNWTAEGFDFVARVEHDDDTRPDEFECYSPHQIRAWENGEWFYCGVVLSVSFNGVKLSDHAASLWGIDCNFPSRRKNPNAYLSEVCEDLQSEGLDVARSVVTRILSALQKV